LKLDKKIARLHLLIDPNIALNRVQNSELKKKVKEKVSNGKKRETDHK
jgi:hypothetical protein